MDMSSANPWYYPRDSFAKEVLNSLTKGASHALLLTAPRGSGKTAFLRNDLTPMAQDAGHPTAIVSFEPAHTAAAEVFLAQLDQPDTAPTALLPSSLPRLSQEVYAPAIEAALDHLSAGDVPAILMLDDIETLGDNPNATPFLATLRTALDRRRNTIRTIFAGGLDARLNHLFRDPEQPFYHFATPIDLPLLETNYLEHQLRTFATLFHRPLTLQKAEQYFTGFQNNPRLFREWMTQIAMRPDLSLAAVAEQVWHDAIGPTLQSLWADLSPRHRTLARVIAEDARGLFGATGAARYKALTQTPAPSAAHRQSLVRRLETSGLVDRFDRERQIRTETLRQWILARPDEDFFIPKG